MYKYVSPSVFTSFFHRDTFTPSIELECNLYSRVSRFLLFVAYSQPVSQKVSTEVTQGMSLGNIKSCMIHGCLSRPEDPDAHHTPLLTLSM